MAEPFGLLKKAQVFLEQDIYPILRNYPNAEKYSLCREIKDSCLSVIRNASMYSKKQTPNRIEHLHEIDAELINLLTWISISRSQKYITEKKALYLQRKVEELGRMNGGVMKAFIAAEKQKEKPDRPGRARSSKTLWGYP